MGTTTFFLKNNDLGKPLNKMGKETSDNINSCKGFGLVFTPPMTENNPENLCQM